MSRPLSSSSPKLTLGKGTRVNCQSPRMAKRLTAALQAIGVPVEAVRVGQGELPAIRVQAPVEVHFERPVEVAFS